MNGVENERTEILCVRVLRQYKDKVRSVYVTLVLLLHHVYVSITPINSLTSSVC